MFPPRLSLATYLQHNVFFLPSHLPGLSGSSRTARRQSENLSIKLCVAFVFLFCLHHGSRQQLPAHKIYVRIIS